MRSRFAGGPTATQEAPCNVREHIERNANALDSSPAKTVTPGAYSHSPKRCRAKEIMLTQRRSTFPVYRQARCAIATVPRDCRVRRTVVGLGMIARIKADEAMLAVKPLGGHPTGNVFAVCSDLENGVGAAGSGLLLGDPEVALA